MVIEEKVFDEFEKGGIYVKCTCGEHLIEFKRDDCEEVPLFHINFYGYYSLKVEDRYPDFWFNSETEFKYLVDTIKGWLDGTHPNEFRLFHDYNLPDKRLKRKGPGVLLVGGTPDEFGFIKYSDEKSRKKDKCTWEILLDKGMADKLYQKLVKEIREDLVEMEKNHI